MRELKKYALDLRLTAVEKVHERYVLLRLTHDEPLPTMLPGQFVEVRVDGSTEVPRHSSVVPSPLTS